MIIHYNRYYREPGSGYALCFRDDFWTPALCDAVENAVTGIFHNTGLDMRIGQPVQQACWVSTGGLRYFMVCNVIKESSGDAADGSRNIYTADLILVDLPQQEENAYFYTYENVFLNFNKLHDLGKAYQAKRDPAIFAPGETDPIPEQETLPLGLVKKFVAEPAFNDRCIRMASWWSACDDRILILHFDGLSGVLETVMNLYHMLPLYARKRFGFTSYTADPADKLRRAPGCSVLCTQQRDRQLSPCALPAGSGEIDFTARACSPATVEDRYYHHAFLKLVKTDRMDHFNHFLIRNWSSPEVRALMLSGDILAREALFMLYAVKCSLPYLQPGLREREQVAEYLRALDGVVLSGKR